MNLSTENFQVFAMKFRAVKMWFQELGQKICFKRLIKLIGWKREVGIEMHCRVSAFQVHSKSPGAPDSTWFQLIIILLHNAPDCTYCPRMHHEYVLCTHCDSTNIPFSFHDDLLGSHFWRFAEEWLRTWELQGVKKMQRVRICVC